MLNEESRFVVYCVVLQVPGDIMKRLRLRTEAESQKVNIQHRRSLCLFCWTVYNVSYYLLQKLVALTKKPTEKQFIKQGSMVWSLLFVRDSGSVYTFMQWLVYHVVNSGWVCVGREHYHQGPHAESDKERECWYASYCNNHCCRCRVCCAQVSACEHYQRQVKGPTFAVLRILYTNA